MELSPEQLQEMMQSPEQLQQLMQALQAGAQQTEEQQHAPLRLPLVEIPADASTEVVFWFGEEENKQCCVGTPAR